MPPKTVSVTGFKNSGKTMVVEALVKELSTRGRRVGTLKHTADDIYLDTPGKDTSRHRDAGSIATGILQDNTTALFLEERLSDRTRVHGGLVDVFGIYHLLCVWSSECPSSVQ